MYDSEGAFSLKKSPLMPGCCKSHSVQKGSSKASLDSSLKVFKEFFKPIWKIFKWNSLKDFLALFLRSATLAARRNSFAEGMPPKRFPLGDGIPLGRQGWAQGGPLHSGCGGFTTRRFTSIISASMMLHRCWDVPPPMPAHLTILLCRHRASEEFVD